jgi:hypothetical protein
MFIGFSINYFYNFSLNSSSYKLQLNSEWRRETLVPPKISKYQNWLGYSTSEFRKWLYWITPEFQNEDNIDLSFSLETVTFCLESLFGIEDLWAVTPCLHVIKGLIWLHFSCLGAISLCENFQCYQSFEGKILPPYLGSTLKM